MYVQVLQTYVSQVSSSQPKDSHVIWLVFSLTDGRYGAKWIPLVGRLKSSYQISNLISTPPPSTQESWVILEYQS